MSVENLSGLLKKLSLPLLQKMVKLSNAVIDRAPGKKTVTKTDTVAGLIEWSYEDGINKFIEKVKVEDLRRALQEGKIKVDSKETKKSELKELFMDAVSNESVGIDGFFAKLELNTLKGFVKLLEFETDAKSRKEYADDLADEILLNGSRTLFEKLKLADMKEAGKLIGVKTSGGKINIMYHILNIAFPGLLSEDEEAEENDSEEEEETSNKQKNKKSSGGKRSTSTSQQSSSKKTSTGQSKKKKIDDDEVGDEFKVSRSELNDKIRQTRKPIQKGITRDELQQHYWEAELKEFCAANKIKKAGRRREIESRILAYLEDPTNTGYKQKKTKRKGAPKGSESPASKKAKTSNNE